MEDPKTEARALGGVLLVAGAWLVAAALRGDPNALLFQAGMDGAIVAVVVATLLALAHGLRYRTVIVMMAPIVALQALVIRRVGFPVEAYPVDWQTYPQWRPLLSFDIGGTIAATDKAVREWEGLIAYRLTGRTDGFFPAP